jgi:hypothetical protein
MGLSLCLSRAVLPLHACLVREFTTKSTSNINGKARTRASTMVVHSSTTASRASVAPASPVCNYPACGQQCAQKRNGSPHKKCEPHRRQHCKYQTDYVRRKRDEGNNRSNWKQCLRRLFPSPALPHSQGAQHDQQSWPTGNVTLSLAPVPTATQGLQPPTALCPLVARGSGSERDADAQRTTSNCGVCSYPKCCNPRAVGRDRRPRSKCDYHLEKHRQYQKTHRKRVCSLDATTEPSSALPHPEPTNSHLHPLGMGLRTLWVSEGTDPFGAMYVDVHVAGSVDTVLTRVFFAGHSRMLPTVQLQHPTTRKLTMKSSYPRRISL